MYILYMYSPIFKEVLNSEVLVTSIIKKYTICTYTRVILSISCFFIVIKIIVNDIFSNMQIIIKLETIGLTYILKYACILYYILKQVLYLFYLKNYYI